MSGYLFMVCFACVHTIYSGTNLLIYICINCGGSFIAASLKYKPVARIVATSV